MSRLQEKLKKASERIASPRQQESATTVVSSCVDTFRDQPAVPMSFNEMPTQVSGASPKVFVDSLFVWTAETYGNEQAAGHGSKNGHQWCHLWAADPESIDLLHSIAKKIGLKREWFQNKKDFPHYDLVPAKREKAIEAGAIEIELKDWLTEKKNQNKKISDETSVGEFSCPDCHSLEVWLPRIPGIDAGDRSNWRCLICKPPANQGLVKERRGPSVDAMRAVDVTGELIDHPDAAKSVVVVDESRVCANCCGRMVAETPLPNGQVLESCWNCRSTAPRVLPEHEPSNGHWRNPFLLAIQERSQNGKA